MLQYMTNFILGLATLTVILTASIFSTGTLVMYVVRDGFQVNLLNSFFIAIAVLCSVPFFSIIRFLIISHPFFDGEDGVKKV